MTIKREIGKYPVCAWWLILVPNVWTLDSWDIAISICNENLNTQEQPTSYEQFWNRHLPSCVWQSNRKSVLQEANRKWFL